MLGLKFKPLFVWNASSLVTESLLFNRLWCRDSRCIDDCRAISERDLTSIFAIRLGWCQILTTLRGWDSWNLLLAKLKSRLLVSWRESSLFFLGCWDRTYRHLLSRLRFLQFFLALWFAFLLFLTSVWHRSLLDFKRLSRRDEVLYRNKLIILSRRNWIISFFINRRDILYDF